MDLDRQAELELLAERMIVSGGLAGLSIDRLAQEAGYSRPTVYRHFSSKEDALCSVTAKAVGLGEELFGRLVSPLEGNRREQAMAFFIALEQMARFHPKAFELVEMLAFEWMREAASEDAQWRWAEVITGAFRSLEKSFNDAANQRELTFRSELNAADVAFHSITMAFAAYASILRNSVCYQLAEMDDCWKRVRMALHTYWDGLNWQPLSTKFDYEESHARLLKDVFPEYWLRGQTELLEKEVDL